MLNWFGLFLVLHKLWVPSFATSLFESMLIHSQKSWVILKYYLKKIDASFHQRFPNMVQRLFADVIHDAIWFMNIHEHFKQLILNLI
jgi:hypothetical protein